MWLLVFVLVAILAVVISVLREKVKDLKEAIYRFEKFPQCFYLQDAVDKRLTEVATDWYQYSKKFAKKGTETDINARLDTFNKLYSLVEDTFGKRVKLREKDVRNYLPEEFRRAS